MARVAWLILAACAPHRAIAPAPAATAGISIALYQGSTDATSYGVVDDRRWVELGDRELALDHIEPGASLASLVIEPLGGEPLTIERCAREALLVPAAPVAPTPPTQLPRARIMEARLAAIHRVEGIADPPPVKPASTVTIAAAPIVRCTVHAAPGKRLVRILYVSHSLAYTAQHELAMTAPDRATLASRFTFATPNWRERADVTVFDGAPGGDHPPTELAHGPVALDGSIAILAPKPREVPARLVRIYDGAIATPEVDASDVSWNAESVHFVWVWIELLHTTLSPGPVRARIEVGDEPVRELELPATLREPGTDLRLPLWPDEALSGSRVRLSDTDGESQLSERLLLSISNLGEVSREVWIEEHARRARHRRIDRAWPKQPVAVGDVVREKLEVKPHTVERIGFTVVYSF